MGLYSKKNICRTLCFQKEKNTVFYIFVYYVNCQQVKNDLMIVVVVVAIIAIVIFSLKSPFYALWFHLKEQKKNSKFWT